MVLQRNEINEKDTWDLSTIYATDQAWEEALKQLNEKVQTATQYEGHLLDSAKSLLEITEFSLDMERQVEKLYVYAHMKNDHVLSALLEDTSPDASGSKGSPLSSRPELVASSNWDFDSRVVFECNDKCSYLVQPKKW